jgi:hypothetical protein
MFSENIQNQRVITIFDELKSSGRVENNSDIARKLETHPQTISKIYKGVIGVPKSMITALVKVFDASEIYIYRGEEPKFLSELSKPNYKKSPNENNAQENEKTINTFKTDQEMKEKLELQAQLIDALREISSLKDEVIKLKDGSFGKTKRSGHGQ